MCGMAKWYGKYIQPVITYLYMYIMIYYVYIIYIYIYMYLLSMFMEIVEIRKSTWNWQEHKDMPITDAGVLLLKFQDLPIHTYSNTTNLPVRRHIAKIGRPCQEHKEKAWYHQDQTCLLRNMQIGCVNAQSRPSACIPNHSNMSQFSQETLP